MKKTRPTEEELKAANDCAWDYGLGYDEKHEAFKKSKGVVGDPCGGSRYCHAMWFEDAFLYGVEWQKQRAWWRRLLALLKRKRQSQD
jgi:hypothetical protein